MQGPPVESVGLEPFALTIGVRGGARMNVGAVFWDIVPYVTIAILVVGTWWRYRYDKFGWTTRSSQLYESRLLRIGSPLFHFGILVVIFGHIIGLVIPESWTSAIGLSQEGYHIQAVALGSIAGHRHPDRRRHSGLPAPHQGPGVHGHHQERQTHVRGADPGDHRRAGHHPRSGPG